MSGINWGHGITLVIILFLVGMIGMVSLATQQTNGMIDKNYYAQELKYQNIINATANLQKQTNNHSILNTAANGITLQLPPNTYQAIQKGSIELLKPNDSSKDLLFSLQPDSMGQQVIASKDLNKGYYLARVYWESEGTPYYHEQKISIEQ